MIDSLYLEYIKERAGLEMLSDESSFLTYKVTGDECFIADMFIKRASRGSGKCKSLIQKVSDIAIARGCKVLSANIAMSDPGRNHTMRAALKLGFVIGNANEKAILILKDLGG
jgi:hypothetical protein